MNECEISIRIITLNIENFERFLSFLQYLCKRKNIKVCKEIYELQQILLSNFAKQTKIKKLVNTSFQELPDWLFINKSSTKFRNERTLNGYMFDEMKSAMQKYARRGIFKECVYSMVEMNFFKWIKGGRRSFTNFYNRIRVILLEDVGIASPRTIPIANKWLKILRTTNTAFPPELIKLSWCLSNNLHYRMYSQIKGYYLANEPPKKESNLRFDLGADKEFFEKDINNLLGCLETKDLACYWWMSKIVDSKHKLQIKRYRSNCSGFLGFAVLKWFFERKSIHPLILENFDVCLEWYKELKIKEASICLFHPMYLYILENKLDFSEIPTKFEVNNLMKYFNDNLLNIRHILRDYVFDMHTRKGRSQKKDSSDFVIEGSLVAFEDKLIEMPFARKSYLQSKLKMGKIQNENQEFTLKARAQLTCSTTRPDVYFAFDSQKRNVVVKGPYLEYETANRTFQLFCLLGLFEKVNIMKINMKLLIPNMFENVPLGCRNKIINDIPYYFLIFDDLYNVKLYPTKIQSSKLWHEEIVVDFDELFSQNSHFGFAIPTKMNEKARLSLLYQLAIRYIFELGDFATRNFVRVENEIWNLDIEKPFVSRHLKWKKTERILLVKTYTNYKNEINAILKKWLKHVNFENPTFYDKWFMIK
jgi:hypothetical protein